jgi:uncharacterized membrane protein
VQSAVRNDAPMSDLDARQPEATVSPLATHARHAPRVEPRSDRAPVTHGDPRARREQALSVAGKPGHVARGLQTLDLDIEAWRSTMNSKAKLLGHPIHQMLIVFPLGLLATSLIFDIVYQVTGNGRWADIAYVMIASGIIGGLLAAIFGLIDWLAIPKGTRAKRIGALHGIGNVVVVGLFAISWLLRYDHPAVPGTGSLILSIMGVALALVTGWLGGELVDRLAVGVDDDAHVNAPSSLSGRPARELATAPQYRTPR